MAEALFEDGEQHPIELYLREASDLAFGDAVLPGGLADLYEDANPYRADSTLAQLLKLTVRLIRPMLPKPNASAEQSMNRELSERLKYLVISSPLLSSALASHTPRRAPGSRTPSLLDVMHVAEPSFGRGLAVKSTEWSPTKLAILAAAPLTLMAGHFTFALFCTLGYLLFQSIFGARDKRTSLLLRPPPLLQTIASVEALIAAGTFWDTVVTEGFNVLEKEDRSLATSPTVADAQVPLRVALSSTLTTTQNQCDNIRNLFTPLTAPAALTRLSEMYAPPITTSSAVAARSMSPDANRRLSYNPTGRPPSLRLSVSQDFRHLRGHSTSTVSNKRSTWYGNGTHLSGASTLGPSTSPLGRAAKRRSVSGASIFHGQPATPDSSSTTGDDPFDSNWQASSSNSPLERNLTSPVRAGLARRHSARSAGLSPSSQRFMNASILEHGSTGPKRLSLTRPPSPAATAARFTSIPRYSPNSSAAVLKQTLEATMASRRYAVAHMLALRFEGDPEEEADDFVIVAEERDDDSYWEDVRSVVDLFTSTFDDASARLVEALEESEREAAMVAEPSPVTSQHDLPSFDMEPVPFAQRLLFPPGLLPPVSASFAPGPSNIARVAGHMDGIVEGMASAREHLTDLAETLRAYQQARLDLDEMSGASARVDELRSQTLTVYERLRSELGLALRECERSRAPLQNALWPPAPQTSVFDDTPELIKSDGSASSCDSGSGLAYDSPELTRPASLLAGPELELPGLARDDDASAHLLRDTSAAHLPPMGIEQVFEASSGPDRTPPRREKPKLSRQERIELSKVRREGDKAKRQSLIAALGFNATEEYQKQQQQEQDEQLDRDQRDAWGPGTEVVQELKDAIWRVGERKRKMDERLSTDSHSASSSLSSPPRSQIPILHRHQLSQSGISASRSA